MSPFEAATFVGLRVSEAKRILNSGKLRLENVARGYWTLFAKDRSLIGRASYSVFSLSYM
jgi:hypothetical protein